MEPSPDLDVSAPSPLRVAGFLITALGALLAGVGATLTWVTVGIEVAGSVSTPTRGIDVWDGQVVLACAVVMLIAVLVTRMAASSTVRRAAAILVIVVGFVALAIGTGFVVTATSRFEPIEDDALASAISESSGVPEDQVRATLEASIEELGAFTRVGAGPYLAIAGGLAGVIGGVLVLAWTMRPDETPEPTEDGTQAGSAGADEA